MKLELLLQVALRCVALLGHSPMTPRAARLSHALGLGPSSREIGASRDLSYAAAKRSPALVIGDI